MLWLSYHVGVQVIHNTEIGKVYVEFNNKCRALRFKNGKAICKYYLSNRPKICVDFPSNPYEGVDCPGFTFAKIGEEPEKVEEAASEEKEGDPPPKWERLGSCTRCGKCCTSIVSWTAYCPELRDYFEWLSLHQGVVVKRDRRTNIVWIEFKNKCRYLRLKRGKVVCSIYNDRPKICRDFPLDPGIAVNCPGFHFKVADPAKAP
jgi:Fe-S-cluster containining protein